MSRVRRALRVVVCSAAVVFAAVPLFAGFSGTDVFIPSVGRRPGNLGSQWYTLLWIHNPSGTTANVSIAFLERNVPNPAPLVFTDSIPPGDTRRYPNTIGTLFGVEKWGALRIKANVPVLGSCRMYNLPPGGEDKDTQGQAYNVIPASFAIANGQSTKVLGVHQTSPRDDSQFRYNFGWVETTGSTARRWSRGMWQRMRWPAGVRCSGGGVVSQIAPILRGQRVAKGQPCGRSVALGSTPS